VAFIVEAVIVVVVLLSSGLLVDAPKVIPKPRLDVVGVVLSATGLGMFVLGVLQSNTYGWSDPLVIGLMVGGLIVLGVFWWWISIREARGEPALVHPSIFRHRSISAGLPILSTQTFAQAGLLFLIPVFTQSILGFTAFETGVTLLPLSVGVLLTSMTTPPLGKMIYPKFIIQSGLVVLAVGGYVPARSLDGATEAIDLALGLFIGGVGIGLVAGQLPNLILSGVDQKEASEASGLQGTAQNLGMALGTAIIGTVILSVALSALSSGVEASTTLPDETKEAVTEVVQKPFETADAVRLAEDIQELPMDQQEELVEIYDEGTLRGFQAAIMVGGLVALVGALLAFRLPKRKLETEETVEQIVRNPTLPAMNLEMADLEVSDKP
jgi:hypothetical protein